MYFRKLAIQTIKSETDKILCNMFKENIKKDRKFVEKFE